MASTNVEGARDRAVDIVADTVGELMRFWNFTPSMGRIWAILYLSPEPMDAEDIVARSRLSVGSVSMTLQELVHWGVVKRVPGTPGRKRLYTAETDMWAMVGRVFRERELRLVETTIRQLEEALELLDHEGKGTDAAAILRSRYLVTRVRNLLDLARLGERLVQRLANTGAVDLSGIRDLLRARRA